MDFERLYFAYRVGDREWTRLGPLDAVIHTAAQPSHDWAASDPPTDFSVNATGTMNLLEATRKVRPEATFIFTSTNKVYGDTPNRLPLVDIGERLELPEDHRYFKGIDSSMSIVRSALFRHTSLGILIANSRSPAVWITSGGGSERS